MAVTALGQRQDLRVESELAVLGVLQALTEHDVLLQVRPLIEQDLVVDVGEGVDDHRPVGVHPPPLARLLDELVDLERLAFVDGEDELGALVDGGLARGLELPEDVLEELPGALFEVVAVGDALLLGLSLGRPLGAQKDLVDLALRGRLHPVDEGREVARRALAVGGVEDVLVAHRGVDRHLAAMDPEHLAGLVPPRCPRLLLDPPQQVGVEEDLSELLLAEAGDDLEELLTLVARGLGPLLDVHRVKEAQQLLVGPPDLTEAVGEVGEDDGAVLVVELGRLHLVVELGQGHRRARAEVLEELVLLVAGHEPDLRLERLPLPPPEP